MSDRKGLVSILLWSAGSFILSGRFPWHQLHKTYHHKIKNKSFLGAERKTHRDGIPLHGEIGWKHLGNVSYFFPMKLTPLSRISWCPFQYIGDKIALQNALNFKLPFIILPSCFLPIVVQLSFTMRWAQFYGNPVTFFHFFSAFVILELSHSGQLSTSFSSSSSRAPRYSEPFLREALKENSSFLGLCTPAPLPPI